MNTDTNKDFLQDLKKCSLKIHFPKQSFYKYEMDPNLTYKIKQYNVD